MASQNPLFARYGFDTEYDTLDTFLDLILRSYDEDKHQLRIRYAKSPMIKIGGIDRFFVVQQTDSSDPKRIIAIDAPGTAVHMSIVDTRNEPCERNDAIDLSNERLPFVANDDSLSSKTRRNLVHRENSEDKYGFRVYRHFIVRHKSSTSVAMPLYIDGCVPFYDYWNFGYSSYEIAVLAAKTFLASGQLWDFCKNERTLKPYKVFVARYLKGDGEIYALVSAEFGSSHFLRLISETGLFEDGFHPGFFLTPSLIHIDESTFEEKDDAMLKFGDFIIESIVENSGDYVLGTVSDLKEHYGELIAADMMKFFKIDVKFMRLFHAKQEAQANGSTDS